ncbi:MAG: RNA-binding domain-containing protein [Melioribacteraceae bacterium]
MKERIKESESVELKTSIAELKEALRSISAILNKHKKGELYFGLTNNGFPVKTNFSEKTLRDISQTISNKIEPKIFPSINVIKVNSIDVIKICFEGNQIPYSAEGRYYIRVADEDKQMSSAELKRFIIQNKDQRWDSSIHLSATLKDISTNKVKAFCKLAEIKFNSLQDVFESIGLLKKDHLINAAVILFGKYPEKFFTNAVLSCAVFATNNTADIIDQKLYKGDLFFLLREAENYILQNIHIGMKVEGLLRKDLPEIDGEAFREALINAFLHRDYYDPDFVSVGIFKNRIEIKNPGGPFGGLTIIDITSRNISKRRNEVIADVFNRARFGERKGRGISLILNKEPKTKFELIADLFITTFKRKTNLIPQQSGGINGGLNEGLKLLLNYIEENPGFNLIKISLSIKRPLRTIEKWIDKLKKENLIEFRGAKRTGGYYKK